MTVLLLAVVGPLAGTVHSAQNEVPQASVAAPAPSVNLPFPISGPPPPEPPSVIARDALGRATVRAVRLMSPLRIDGKLDEPVFITAPSMSDFIQNEPAENAPATEKTEVWVFFDSDSVYVVGRCWETHPERMVANEMQRDSRNIPQNEGFAFAFDTFYDRRNSVVFEITAVGGRMDGQVTNESSFNMSWNPVWEFAVGRFEQGWTVETRIPFKSLRYRPGISQIWGFNVRRRNQWKNEVSNLVPIPAVFGNAGHFRAISLAATLVGLEAPSGSANLEIKPFAIAGLTSDRVARPQVRNDVNADWGVDLKYGITQNLTADLTYRTDFAQVEADEQQINLTRFSLFFPEKRDFFLENQGTFEFAGVGGAVIAGSSAATAGGSSTINVPVLFYSRRIGLDRQGSAVPITGGGRVTGRLGRFSIGALDIRSDEAPHSGVAATNFSVLRLKRDVLRKSSVGLVLASRSVAESGIGANLAEGFDGAFRFFDNLTINTFWAKTQSSGRRGDDTSYRAQFDYAGDRYGVQAERMMVGANFNPEIGYVRHPDMRRTFGQARFSPRPRRSKRVRKLYWTGWVDYIENGSGRVDTRQQAGEFAIEFHNGDRYSLRYTNTYEFLPLPLPLSPSATVTAGSYEYANVQTGFTFSPVRQKASGNVSVEYGTFYDGKKATISLSQGRVVFPPHVSVEPTYSLNRVDLAHSEFTAHLVGPRVSLNLTPLMFTAALLQYNSTTNGLSMNLRFRWEYRPGSELFVVLNEQRDTLAGGFPNLASRAFVVKVNRLLRF